METSGGSISYWVDSVKPIHTQKLSADAISDVCIVGGGMTGMTTAYMLCKAGLTVTLLEDGAIGSGETGRTTAHISNAYDDRYHKIAHTLGKDAARVVAESHTAAIDTIEAICKDENIDCDFIRLPGYLFQPDNESEDILDKELEAAHTAGLTAVRKLTNAPGAAFDTGPCLLFPNQGQFHSVKYLAGLTQSIQKLGGKIFTDTHADEITAGTPCIVKTAGGSTVKAQHVVVATNSPVHERFTMHTKQAAYRSYVIGALIPKDSLKSMLLWDTADPYHYVRTQRYDRTQDLLIIDGEDHKTGQANDAPLRFQRLESWARARFSMMSDIKYRWSGQVMEPVDYLGFIGRSPGEDHIYMVTGDSGNGITNGAVAALLLTDLITGKKNPWESTYDPARKSLMAIKEFAKENINVAVQYTDLVRGGDVASSEQIAHDSGAIIRKGMKKIAVYKDKDGKIHERSAVCPHLGCIVDWNSFEKTWDCPCHGSRYDALGSVINGPANCGLKPVDD